VSTALSCEAALRESGSVGSLVCCIAVPRGLGILSVARPKLVCASAHVSLRFRRCPRPLAISSSLCPCVRLPGEYLTSRCCVSYHWNQIYLLQLVSHVRSIMVHSQVESVVATASRQMQCRKTSNHSHLERGTTRKGELCTLLVGSRVVVRERSRLGATMGKWRVPSQLSHA
jgi:hypothetical protein